MEGQFIGLDVGGTKIASATLQDGKLTTRELVKTDISNSDALVGQLRELLTAKAGLPVYIENDASCAALAEAFDEDGRLVCPNLVMFTVGTGVGGGMVFNGRLYRGATSAAEVGHTVIGLDLEEGAPVPEGKHPLP